VLPDPQGGQQLIGPRPRLRGRQAGQLGGEQDVVRDGHVVEQVEELEDHADLAPPELGQPGLAERVDAFAADPDLAAGRPVEPGDQVEQGRFPAAGRPHHRDRLAVADVHGDVRHRGRPTNVMKHAGQARTAVRIEYRPRELLITVCDDGRPPDSAPERAEGQPAGSGGRGLIGLRERIAVYLGELDAGPRPGGGWRLAARIPLDLMAAEDGRPEQDLPVPPEFQAAST